MPHKTKLKAKKGAWFVRLRGSYIPASWQGWLTYIPFTAYLVFSLIAGFAYTGTNLKAVLWVFPNWVAAAAVMTWLARAKS
jgi:sensor histidine kinase YesM